MKKTCTLLTTLFLLAALSQAQPDVTLTVFANGFDRPVDIAHAGDERLFIVEQDGIIWILNQNGDQLPVPFLDIDSKVGSSGNEQGLLGLAFHPGYSSNGYFFVNYTNNSGDTRVARYTVSADPDLADPNSEKIILSADQPFSNHNGGCLKFGPDGYLYIGLGDGGSGGDPQENGQDGGTFLGKMLRIDVDNGDPYAIPASNPFLNAADTLHEIWALGMRNPWRYSFDRTTGDLWIGDVGQDAWEEVDFQPAGSAGGQNYGWDCYEGNHPFKLSGCSAMSGMTFPVAEYANTGSVGCSVTGGFVYRGCEFPALYGRYLFTDYCSGRIWSIVPDGSGSWTKVELENLNDNQFSSFGENDEGELFLAGLGNGNIYRVTSTSTFLEATNPTCDGVSDGAISMTFPPGSEPSQAGWSDGSSEVNRTGLPAGTYSVAVTLGNGCTFFGSVDLAVEFPFSQLPEITVSDDSILTANIGFASYQWFLNGQPIPGATGQTYVAAVSGSYSVQVTNNGGCAATSEPVAVTVSATGELPGAGRVSLSPNPFGSSLRLRLDAVQPLALDVSLADAEGKVFFSEKIQASGSLDRAFDLKALPAGVWFFTIKTESGAWTRSVVKE